VGIVLAPSLVGDPVRSPPPRPVVPLADPCRL